MDVDGKVYLQITRGSAKRDHVFPAETTANIYAYIEKVPRSIEKLTNGVGTITHEDVRWDLCYIKSLNLMPNVLAKQETKESGCYEDSLHKDGKVTECSSSNIYLVKNRKIYTHPATKNILHGCVRMRVEKFAEDLNIPFFVEAFSLVDIEEADELFLTSSTSEVLPIVTVDNLTIDDGKPGPISKKLLKAYEIDARLSDVGQPTTSI